MIELNEKEREMYEYIAECIRCEGYAPSVRDIQSQLSIKSTATVHSYLGRLERAGYIIREQGKSRTIRIREEDDRFGDTVRIPILGRVTAGIPILAEQQLEGYIKLPLGKVKYNNNEIFALRVKGESMIEAGIMDGDIVVVRRTQYAENGTIVVAMVDDEATVKQFYRENGHFRLQPRNPDMNPIIVDEVAILGIVVACTRYYESF